MKKRMTSEQKRWMGHYEDERNGASLYEALAEAEPDTRLKEVFRRMASAETRHAKVWEKKLEDNGVRIREFRPSLRTRILSWVARRFGNSLVLPTVLSLENADGDKYGKSMEESARRLHAEERSHAFLLSHLTGSGSGGVEGRIVERLEGRHRAPGGNAVRAAVLGANDGLVSNLSLVMGVAGAALPEKTILITGLAGLLAGAISMALGEWLSVQSSRELYQHQIETEREEIEMAPDEEEEELALIYEAKGLPEEQAKALAHEIMSSHEKALDTLAREELGIDPEKLGGSAWEAAITSFLLFSAGAIIPVIPFIFLSGYTAIAASIVGSLIGLFLLGAGITLFTARSVLFSGFRQMLFGLAAAALTFFIGHLIGTSLL